MGKGSERCEKCERRLNLKSLKESDDHEADLLDRIRDGLPAGAAERAAIRDLIQQVRLGIKKERVNEGAGDSEDEGRLQLSAETLAAYEEFMERTTSETGLRMKWLVRSLTEDRSEIEEATTNVYLRLLEWQSGNRPYDRSHERGASPRTWLRTIAEVEAGSLKRRLLRRRHLVFMEQIEDLGGSTWSGVDAKLEIEDLVASSSEKDQQLLEFLLLFEAGYSWAEISAAAGNTNGALRTAATRLRQRLQAECEEGTPRGREKKPNSQSKAPPRRSQCKTSDSENSR